MKDFQELLVHELGDLHDAEQQLLKALPKMAKGANGAELKTAFEVHLAETEGHVERLKKAAKMLGVKLGEIPCEGMKGLIKEGDGILKHKDGDPEVIDTALIGAAQKVEHYEMVAYESVIDLASRLGHDKVAELLQQSLNEEIAASDKLADISGEEEIDEELS